jgi:uncharacterized protein (DUF58 family)
MPTVRGWLVAAASVACYLAGWLLGYPELAVPGLGGALALLCGWAWLAVPVRLSVRREIAPARVPRTDLAVGMLTYVNTGRWRSGPTRASDRCGDDEIPVDLPALRPGASATKSYVLPTRRRGHLRVGPLRVTRTDPLGLVRRVREYGATSTLIVHPRAVPVTALPSGRVASLDGARSEQASDGTVTFHSLRPYEFGDDLRRVHWRTSARTNTLMVRQFVDTTLPRTVVLLDTTAAAYRTGEDFELAVDVTASVALSATARGFPVSVHAGRSLSTVDSSGASSTVLLDRLALVAAGGVDDVAGSAAHRPGPGGAALTFVTGADSPHLPRVLALRRRYDRIVVVLVGAGSAPHRLPVPVVAVPDLAAFATVWNRAAA